MMKEQFEPGDHLVSGRRILGAPLYTHHGLFVGAGRVIHYAGNARPGQSGPIEEVSLEDFADGRAVRVRRYRRRVYTREESVERARSRIGDDSYSLLTNNCEHFVEWCITGEHASAQVERAAGIGTGAFATVGTRAGIGVVSSAGAVAGLSAPGTMTGLAAVGGLVGGGAVAGLSILAATPALVATAAVNMTVLRDRDHLPKAERKSRQAGRAAAWVGTALASVGNVVAVSAAGAVPGFSAAGISSGLAAVGTASGFASTLGLLGVSGGAMAAGVAVTVAAPAVAATAVGYGAYRTARWLSARGRPDASVQRGVIEPPPSPAAPV
jgi:hypothetical protein